MAHTLGSLAHACAGSANGANQRSRRQTRRRCRQPSCTIRRIAWCVKSRRDHQAHTWMHLHTNRTTKRRMSGRAAYGSEGGGSVATSTPLVGIVWDHITVPHLPPQPLCSAAVLDAQIMSQSIFAHRIVEMWLACRDDGRDGPVESCEVPGRNQHPPGRSTSGASSTHHTDSTPCTLSAYFELSRKPWVLCFGRTARGRALVPN